MVFTFVKGCEGAGDKKQINTKIACGPQSLKYLLSGPLQKKFDIYAKASQQY